MKLEKQRIVELFLARDDLEMAERADEELPAVVDVHTDAAVLRGLGIDAGLLATQVENLEP